MPILLELDPTSEAASNVALTLVNNTTHYLISEEYPEPAEAPIWASSADADGAGLVSNRHDNRHGQRIVLNIYGSSAADVETKVRQISAKVQKIRREGGTLKRTAPSGNTHVLDMLAGGIDFSTDQAFVEGNMATVAIVFDAKPYWRGAAVTLADHVETTSPVLVFTETGVKGDVPAPARLVVDNDGTVDQHFLMWGAQSRYYDSAATAALFYEAEGRTLMGGSAVATRTGASGGGSNNVVRAAGLTTSFQAIMSTQATGGGAHLTHVGDYRVWARFYYPDAILGGSGSPYIAAFEWGVGDMRRPTINTPVYIDGNRRFQLLDLGLVHLPKVPLGTQRWEGRVLLRTEDPSVFTSVDLDYWFLAPVNEGYGEARANPNPPSPTTFTGRDDYDQTAGALAGKVAPTGGTWSGAGDADDFTVSGSGFLQRTAVSDAGTSLATGRLGILGATTYTTSMQQIRFRTSLSIEAGLLFRYTDVNNFALVKVSGGGGSSVQVNAWVRVAGTDSILGGRASASFIEADVSYTLRTLVDAQGRLLVWFAKSSTALGDPVLGTYSSALATGGTLASGRLGLWDRYTSATAATRIYDGYWSATPSVDAVAYASQSVEVRHDGVMREDSSGTVWAPVSSYNGDYFRIPPAGVEGRTTRILVKMSSTNPDMQEDISIDDLSARVTYVPQYVHVPEA